MRFESNVSVVVQQITRKHKHQDLCACPSGVINLKKPIKQLEFSNWSQFSKRFSTSATGVFSLDLCFQLWGS